MSAVNSEVTPQTSEDSREKAVLAAHGITQMLAELAIEAMESGNRHLLEWRIRPMQAHLREVLNFLEGKEGLQ